MAPGIVFSEQHRNNREDRRRNSKPPVNFDQNPQRSMRILFTELAFDYLFVEFDT